MQPLYEEFPDTALPFAAPYSDHALRKAGYCWYEAGMCRQVSSRLASGAEALKTSGDLRSLSLRQSISGALQRVSGIRSPAGSAPPPGEPT